MRHLYAVVTTALLAGSAFSATINVPGDHDTIQDAIDASEHGDVVVVAPGTYTGSGSHVVDMKGKEITLMASGSAGETIIDGEGTRRCVVFHTGETPNTKLSGFTIYRGRNTSYDFDESGQFSWWEQQFGGGLMIYSCSPTIESCIILENSTTWDAGGAMLVPYEAETSPLFTDCKFIGNTAQYGGGIRGDGATPTLTGCEFTNNSSTGTFYPTGGAIHARASSIWHLENCSFEGNSAGKGGGGIGIDELATVILVDCTFNNNSANYGGGISIVDNCDIHLTNCVFTSNTASTDGGGIWCDESSNCSMTDTAVCSNAPDQIYGSWIDNGGNTVEEECLVDSDGDGIGDNEDAFPDDPNEWADADSDGVGDNGDAFPNDSSETADSDGDGVGDNGDAFPNDPDETVDSDGDGIGDNEDLATVGPCCVSTGCHQLAEVACVAMGGSWLGAVASCDDCPAVEEPPVTGACCVEGLCVSITSDDCFDLGGSYAGDDSTCDSVNCPTYCDGDTNHDGTVDVFDLLKVIDGWGDVCP